MIVQDVTTLPTLTTWWAHNPQFHRIKTWLSCTPCSQDCSSRVASYAIHELPSERSSILVWNTIIIPVALNPFHTLFPTTNDCLSAWNFLWYLRTLLSMCFNCSTREVLICSFMGLSQIITLIAFCHCRSAPLPIRKYEGTPEERMTTS